VKRRLGLAGLALSALFVLGLAASLAAAQSGGGYDLTWSSVDGGGTTVGTGGGYTLGGTAGQPDAGLLSGGAYTLDGGFWAGGVPAGGHWVYLPLVVRNH